MEPTEEDEMEVPTRKKARKEEFDASRNDGATQKSENALVSNIHLTYDSLRIVFQYLNARELASAAMVCSLWLQAADDEKKMRGVCCITLDTFKSGFCNNHLSVDQLSWHINKKVKIKPSLGFFIFNKELLTTQRKIIEHIKTVLPEHCEVVMLYTEPCIYMNCKDMNWQRDWLDPYPDAAYAFLPQIRNVKIKSFKLTNCKHYKMQQTAEYREIISTINDHKISMSHQETSTCLMLFYNEVTYNGLDDNMATDWISVIQESIGSEIVSVWGGEFHDFYTTRIYLDKKKMKRAQFFTFNKPHCTAVLITGAIQTWSVVLDKCNTVEQIKKRLKLFKAKVKLKKHSIAFMFKPKYDENVESENEDEESESSDYIEYEFPFDDYRIPDHILNLMRSSKKYRIPDHIRFSEEPQIFSTLFPTVPLVGCLGWNGFGKTTSIDEINEERNSKAEHKCNRSEPWYYGSATVFLIITYG